MSLLLSPMNLRSTHLRNRIMVAPMCQYSAVAGVPQPWHLVHLGAMARGGAGLVMAEATAVLPEGRISPQDTGMWSDEQARAWASIVAFLRSQGAVAGVQLAHAGNKASTYRPWSGSGSVPVADGGWATVGPSATGYPGLAAPQALSQAGIGEVVAAFVAAAERALAAGFDTVEVHAAHGYLLHQFLSPLANDRTDAYGGDLAGRARLLLEVVSGVRAIWPADRALLVRISATDGVTDGHTIDDSVVVCGWLRDLGVDLIDVSSGGVSPDQEIIPEPGYQVSMAARIRAESAIATAAVGKITEPSQAEAILAQGSADLVALGRALLRDPQWPLRAAHELGEHVDWPPQLVRGQFP
ncbi:MAG: NADH:flavin oxidoreductase/NADH oxidase [Candidatus Nanopelagicales bacterium]